MNKLMPEKDWAPEKVLLPLKALLLVKKATLVDKAPSEILAAGKITPPPEMIKPLAEANPPAPLICNPPRKVEVLADCRRIVPELVMSPEVLITKTFGIRILPLVEIFPPESMYKVPEAWDEVERLSEKTFTPVPKYEPEVLILPDGSRLNPPAKKPARLPMDRPW